MNKKEYLAKRAQLLNEARTLVNSGNLEGAEAKKTEIESLDNQFSQIAATQASLAALENNAVVPPLENLGVVPPAGGQELLLGSFSAQAGNTSAADIVFDNAHPGYENAWAKKLMGQKMTNEEQQVFSMVNEYMHTKENTGAVIPKTVTMGILDMAAEKYPLFADASKTYIKGNMTLVLEDSAKDAQWYDEATKAEDDEIRFRTMELTGCELAKNVRISWKLKSMAVPDFIAYVQRESAAKMGKALGYGACHGKGKPAPDETFKPEPLGVITALLAEKDTPQISTYTKGKLSYPLMTAARAKIKSRFSQGVKIYANSQTIWNEIANVTDTTGKPLFITDLVNTPGVGRILSMVVDEDDSLKDGQILFSNMAEGYAFNINEDITVRPFEKPDERQTLYVAYSIVDGAPQYTNAHSLLQYTGTK